MGSLQQARAFEATADLVNAHADCVKEMQYAGICELIAEAMGRFPGDETLQVSLHSEDTILSLWQCVQCTTA